MIIILITFIGALLRFYNIGWGDSYFFHPDERNIAHAISQLDFNHSQFNPKFWAYGSLPIYLIYLVAWVITNTLTYDLTSFENYIVIGRIFSAVSSTLMIPLCYILARKLTSTRYALLACFWITFLPGMIQFAHFTTFETFLTLQYIIIALLAIRTCQNVSWQNIFALSIVFGFSIGTKITSVVLLPLLPATFVIYYYNQRHSMNFKWPTIASSGLKLAVSLCVTAAIALSTSPYFILDWDGFMNSLSYESGVANGSLPVFYTQQFNNTVPGIYQITRIFPYILTVPLTAISLVSVIYFLYKIYTSLFGFYRRRKPIPNRLTATTILCLVLCLYLGFHIYLFVKWTRYMVPALPFLSILSAVMLSRIEYYFRNNPNRFKILILFTSIWIVLSGISFWKIYDEIDHRVQSAIWAGQNIDPADRIASEPFDLGILPFNTYLSSRNIILLPLYELDDPNLNIEHMVFEQIQRSDYFINLSSRLSLSRQLQSNKYPRGSIFYQNIVNDSSEWEKIAQFPNQETDCSFLNFNCFGGYYLPDETFNVFDHPTIKIFKRVDTNQTQL